MIIYRLENSNGEVPYDLRYPSTVIKNMMESHEIMKPFIYNDVTDKQLAKLANLRKIASDNRNNNKRVLYYCFKSKKDLNDWYSHWIGSLFNEGYQIIEYDVKDYNIVFGKKQVCILV
jgi:hypothetical protein